MDREIWVKDTESRFVLEGYVLMNMKIHNYEMPHSLKKIPHP